MSLLKLKSICHNIRSQSLISLEIPLTKNYIGKIAFKFFASHKWNTVQVELKLTKYLSVNQFKSLLDNKDVPQCCCFKWFSDLIFLLYVILFIYFLYLISELFNVFCLFILSVLFCYGLFIYCCMYYVASIRALLQKSPMLSQFSLNKQWWWWWWDQLLWNRQLGTQGLLNLLSGIPPCSHSVFLCLYLQSGRQETQVASQDCTGGLTWHFFWRWVTHQWYEKSSALMQSEVVFPLKLPSLWNEVYLTTF